jgi:uncharacterized protein YycO
MPLNVYAAENPTISQLTKSYENMKKQNLIADSELNDYIANYSEGYTSINEYESAYKDLIQYQDNTISKLSSNNLAYYYDTGKKRPSKATYSNKNYNLLKKVKKGDIVYEAAGGFGITGHILIVEGKYRDGGKEYIRIVEAMSKGVKRGILDDKRFKDKKGTVIRLNKKNATSNTNLINILGFCTSQIDKKYKIDFKKNTKSTEKDWYCSELVWAGYKSVKIDIETTVKPNEPGVTPRDVFSSNKFDKIIRY